MKAFGSRYLKIWDGPRSFTPSMQGLAKQSINTMKKLPLGNWRPMSGPSNKLTSVQRVSDGEIFKLGDFVTNGTQMRGKIEKFETDEKVVNRKPGSPLEIHVTTDWSGIGMNLDSVSHIKNPHVAAIMKLGERDLVLPSAYQPGDFVGVKFRLDKEHAEIIGAQVTKVAFTKNKVLYDVEIGVGSEMVTRLHSIDSVFIVSLAPDKKAS